MTRSLIYLFLPLLLIGEAIPAAGQDVKVTSSFDSSRIYIGDQVRFTVTIDQPENLNLALPAFRDTLTENIEIISGPVIDSAKKDGRVRIFEHYLVTSFDSGRYQVPPVFAEVKNESGLKRFYSDYAFLEVQRVKITPPDTAAKIFDIVKPYRAPVTAGEIIPWVLAAGIAAALVWLAIRYIRRRKLTQGEVEIFVNPDPAHVIALRELERLRDQKIWQSGEIKLYYTRLTEILRQYLENRYHVYSLELTTSETLAALLKTGFRKDSNYELLRNVLTGADLVKFAKYQPAPAEHDSAFTEAWNFVSATKEELTVPGGETGDEKKGELKS